MDWRAWPKPSNPLGRAQWLTLVALALTSTAALAQDVFSSSPHQPQPLQTRRQCAHTDPGSFAIVNPPSCARAVADGERRFGVRGSFVTLRESRQIPASWMFKAPTGPCAEGESLVFFTDAGRRLFDQTRGQCDERFAASPGVAPAPPHRPDGAVPPAAPTVQPATEPADRGRPLPSVSRSGCPYPKDIDPNRMDPRIPVEGRIQTAESVFQQRQRLCLQGRGSLVKGGCVPYCVGGLPASSPASQPPGRMLPLPDAPKPPPRANQAGQTERICNLQTLAAWIHHGYNTTLAVARMRVVNAKNPNTYVLMLSGMQPQLGKSTNLADAYIAWLNVQALSTYRAAIMDAVAALPRGSTLILAGHSQGGMEAQNAVENLTHRWGFKVEQVISFGAPTSAVKTAGVQYLNVRDRQDPIPLLDRLYDLTGVKVIDAGRGRYLDPWVAHGVYSRPESGLVDAPVPMSASLREPCLEVDVGSLQRFDTPTFFTRAFSGPQNPVVRNNPTPRNPDLGLVNCFWVSLAQDRFLAEGLPYFAQCERGAPSWNDIERTLANQYGHRALDDHLGPTTAASAERHRAGVFAETSVQGLQVALGRMGPGARGIVVASRPPHTTSHAFNVQVDANNVPRYFDAQTVVDGRQYFRPPVRVSFYRTN